MNIAFAGGSVIISNLGTRDCASRLVLGIVLPTVPFVSGVAMFQSSTATIVSATAKALQATPPNRAPAPLYQTEENT